MHFFVTFFLPLTPPLYHHGDLVSFPPFSHFPLLLWNAPHRASNLASAFTCTASKSPHHNIVVFVYMFTSVSEWKETNTRCRSEANCSLSSKLETSSVEFAGLGCNLMIWSCNKIAEDWQGIANADVAVWCIVLVMGSGGCSFSDLLWWWEDITQFSERSYQIWIWNGEGKLVQASAIPCQSSATVFQDQIGLDKLCAVQICTRSYISPIPPTDAIAPLQFNFTFHFSLV